MLPAAECGNEAKNRGSDGMEYAFNEVDGNPMVTLSGRFTYGGAAKMHDIIANWDFDRRPSITVDLRYVTFIDSTAIGMLFLLSKRARDAGGSLTLINASASVRKTLNHASIENCAIHLN